MQKIQRWLVLYLAALMAAPAGAFAADEAAAAASAVQAKVDSKTIAVVNNDPIFSDELDREVEPYLEQYKKVTPPAQQTQAKRDEIRSKILERLVEERLLLQEARKKNLRATKVEIERGSEQFKEPFYADADGKPVAKSEAEKAFQDQLAKEGITPEQFQKKVEEQILKVKLIEQDIKSKIEPPKEETIKQLFQRVEKKINNQPQDYANKDEEESISRIAEYFKKISGEQVRLRHILIRPKAASAEARAQARKKIDDLLQRIKNGEDFSTLARRYSEDTISREQGGDLDFMPVRDLGIPEIEAAVGKMKEGEVSPVLSSELGLHLVKLIERRAPHKLELDEVQRELRTYLMQKDFTDRFERYLGDIKSRASIHINK